MRVQKDLEKRLLKNAIIRKCAPYVLGMISFVSPKLALRQGGNTSSARYCYRHFIENLASFYDNSTHKLPKTVMEIGPGDSIGTGLCALLAGSSEYYALDVVKHTNIESNLAVFDELIELFKARASTRKNQTTLERYAFPRHILSDEVLEESLNQDRLFQIRNAIKSMDGQAASPASIVKIEYIAPWQKQNTEYIPKADLMFSNSVLEHIDDLDNIYSIMGEALSESGHMLHSIDFSSHRLTPAWNGHWMLSDFQWKLIRGRRVYAINREPLSTHLELSGKKCEIISVWKNITEENTIDRKRLSGRFQSLSDDDLKTKQCIIIARKKRDASHA